MPGPRSPSSHHVASKLWRVKNHLDCIGHCLNCCGSRTLNFRLLFILRFILFAFFFVPLSFPFLCALWLLLPYVADSYKAKHIRNHTKAQRERDRDSVWAREAKKLNVIEFIYGFVCSLFTLSVCVCECFFLSWAQKTAKNVDGFVNKYFIYFRPATNEQANSLPLAPCREHAFFFGLCALIKNMHGWRAKILIVLSLSAELGPKALN